MFLLIVEMQRQMNGCLSKEETWKLVGISKMAFYSIRPELRRERRA